MFFNRYDEYDVVESTSNLIMSKLNYEFDMMFMEHRQNLANIEYQAICENCSDDDIAQMYLEEADATQEKSKGILTRIIDAIKNLFKKIKEFIFSSKDKKPKDPNEKITLPEDPDALTRETKGVLARIKGFLSGKKETIKDEALKGTVSGACTVLSSKATEWLLNTAGRLTNDVQSTLNDADRQVKTKNMSTEQQNECRGIINKLHQLGNRIMKCGKKITQSNPDDEKSGNTSDTDIDSQLQTLLNENKEINHKLSQLETKMNGTGKNDTWKDRRESATIQKIMSKPVKKRSSKEQAKLIKLVDARGVLGPDRKKYIDAINNLRIRLNDNNSKIKALKKSKEKADKRAARNAASNVKKGNTSTSDLLNGADDLMR